MVLKASIISAHFIKGMNFFCLICACLILSGCGFKWPSWATIDKDPLAFMGTGRNKSPEKESTPPELSKLSRSKEFDPVLRTEKIDLEKEDNIKNRNFFDLDLDYYFDERLDNEERIERLERALVAMHRDMKEILPELKLYLKGEIPSVAESSGPIIAAPPQPSMQAPALAATPAGNTPSNAPQNILQAPAAQNQPQPAPAVKIAAQKAYMPPLPPIPGGKHIAAMKEPLQPPQQQITSQEPPLPTENLDADIDFYDSPDQAPQQAAAPAQPAPEDYARSGLPPPAPEVQGQTEPLSPGPRPVSNGNSAIVSGIRIGEHPDRVRIVFDVTKETPYRLDLDNSEKLLIVELPNAKWKTPTDYEQFKKNPVLSSYRVESFNNGQGNLFALQLSKPTQIIYEKVFDALSGGGKRIVIDVKK